MATAELNESYASSETPIFSDEAPEDSLRELATDSFYESEPNLANLRVIEGSVRIGGTNVHLTYREPENSDDITDPIPLAIAGGWCAPEGAYANLSEAVAQRGRPTFTVGTDRSVGKFRQSVQLAKSG